MAVKKKKSARQWGPEGPHDVRTSEWSKEWMAFFAAFGGPKEAAAELCVSYQTLWRIGVRGDAANGTLTKLVRVLSGMRGLKKSPL